VPPLHISEFEGRVRLGLEGFGYVEGETLQGAADELVARLLHIAMAFRTGGIGPVYSELCPDQELLDFVWRLGEYAAAGVDPRELLFGPKQLAE
jgi:hypothetical protein